MGEKYKTFVNNLDDRRQEVLEKWREKSNDLVRNFIQMYGAMNQVKEQIMDVSYGGHVGGCICSLLIALSYRFSQLELSGVV